MIESGSLATPGAVHQLLRAYGFRIKKSLGQNFLIDKNILAKIVQAAQVGPGDVVLEIGPGIGALTQALAEAGARVVAVEIDRELVKVLHHTMAGYEGVQVVHGDALAMPLSELLPGGVSCRVVANLPYYITPPLIMRMYEEQLPMQVAVVLVQREVAARRSLIHI